MSKILITGNGFDLYHQLPTMYSNFIETLDRIDKSEFTETYYEFYFKADEKFKKVVFDETQISKIKSLLNNKWYRFFKDEYIFDSWIDFESKLEDTLKIIWEFIRSIEHNIFKITDVGINNPQKFETAFTTKSKKIGLLYCFELVNPYPGSQAHFFFNSNYTIVFNDNYIGLNEDQISKMLLNELDMFIEIFDLYFQTFVIPLVNHLQDAEYKRFEGIDHYFTFNYTNCFDLLYAISNSKIQHLHGRIGTVNNNNNIVLGFNDVDENLSNKKFYIPFTKYFQKLNKVTDYKFLNTIENLENRYETTTIYFWGHSLDISDKVYFEEIIKLLKSQSHIIAKIFFHNNSSRFRMLINLIHMIGKEDIDMLMKKDQIQFIYLTQKNIEEELCFKSPENQIYV